MLGNSSFASRAVPKANSSGRRKAIFRATAIALLGACGVSSVYAQSYAPVVITPPVVDTVDGNNVSILTGKIHYSIPAVSLGDVSFAPVTTNQQFDKSAVNDANYGHVQDCINPSAPDSYTIITDCVSTQASLIAIYGEQRASFQYYNGQYTSVSFDGSAFSDNGSSCTWTQHDGTQVVYAAFHTAGNPLCQSNNISKIVRPDGRIQTYYYYGSLSTAPSWTPSPIISIATNSGFLLKYNYSGTPVWGAETSVVAINRAFETCDPTALSCTLANQWPTATLSWVNKPLSSPDDLLAAPNPNLHYIFTLTDQAHKQHVFELDSIFRVASYQPPEATTPIVTYTLCSLHADGHTLTNCWGKTNWVPPAYGVFDQIAVLFDLVYTSTRNGQLYSYGSTFGANSPPGWSTWGHAVSNPQGKTMSAVGNATPGMENFYGPTDSIVHYDGTTDYFERSVQNSLAETVTPLGVQKHYGWDLRQNLGQIYKNPVGSTQTSMSVGSATYATTCTDPLTCNEPLTVTDGNGNVSSFNYDSTRAGPFPLIVTGPAVSVTNPAAPAAQPQTRNTYTRRNAWYLSSSGVMISDPNPIWLLATQSYCRETAGVASGTGCTGSDEVLTSYDYGPDSGPNNLILRGKTVTADGQTLRTCYLHDKRGNKMSEISPNAGRTGCPDY